jgi:hypothetical protein
LRAQTKALSFSMEDTQFLTAISKYARDQFDAVDDVMKIVSDGVAS